MKNPSEIATSLSHPAVVGTVHSEASLAEALKLNKGICDWLELRLDAFFPDVNEVLRAARKMPAPRIVTVRHPSEGGASRGITPRQRRELYAEFIPVAGMLDIELRQAKAMRETMRQAQEAGVGVILSHHDFRAMPSLRRLQELARRARDAGARVFKVAAMTRNARELAALIEFLAAEKERQPVAAMGMGPLGKVSRLALAAAGSCLNYGYLGSPNATGQWPAATLKLRIAELRCAD